MPKVPYGKKQRFWKEKSCFFISSDEPNIAVLPKKTFFYPYSCFWKISSYANNPSEGFIISPIYLSGRLCGVMMCLCAAFLHLYALYVVLWLWVSFLWIALLFQGTITFSPTNMKGSKTA